MKNDSLLIVAGSLAAIIALTVGAPSVATGQSEPTEVILLETANHISMTDAHTRCGKYFVLETHTYGETEVKQVHVVMPMSTANVALVGLYYNDVHTIIDESKDTPVLLRKKDESGREADELRLSRAEFEEAKACLPPPGEK